MYTYKVKPQNAYSQYGDNLTEQFLRQSFPLPEYGFKPKVLELPGGLDISMVAGDQVVVTHLGIYPYAYPKAPRYTHAFSNEHGTAFEVALFIRDVRDSYMEPSDMSFKLKGVVFYPQVWAYVIGLALLGKLDPVAGILE